MKGGFVFRLIAALSSLLLGTAFVAFGEEAGSAPTTWAVVVGISQYRHAELPNLRFAAEDARSFCRLLQDVTFSNCPPENIVLLLDQAATVENIRSALGDFVARKARENDTVVFYFAGHGGIEADFLSSATPERAKFLLAYNTEPDMYYGTGLNMQEDLGYIFHNRVQARRILCFLDCCHAGAAQGASSRSVSGRGFKVVTALDIPFEKPAKDLSIAPRGKEMLIGSACQPTELALEISSVGHGAFTYSILQALQGDADADQSRTVSLSELKSFVTRETARLTQGKQNPHFTSSSNQDFSFNVAENATETGLPEPATHFLPTPVAKGSVQGMPVYSGKMIAEADYLTEIREENGFLWIAVVGGKEKTQDVLEALSDARRKQRQQLRKHLQLDAAAAEAVYDRGEVIDAEELGNRAWYMVMKYPLQ